MTLKVLRVLILSKTCLILSLACLIDNFLLKTKKTT